MIYIELLIFFIYIVVIIVVLMLIGRRRNKKMMEKHMEHFKSFLSGLDLQYDVFHGRIYGYGRYKNHYISFKYSLDGREGLSKIIPGLYDSFVSCRVKIPGTTGLKLGIAVSASNRSAKRSSLRWINPEAGFYIVRPRRQNEAEALDIFSRLSYGAKQKMVETANKYSGSCLISSDWETVMIGRDNAQKIVGYNADALNMLDFQTRIPFNISCGNLIDYLDLTIDSVERLSMDLREDVE